MPYMPNYGKTILDVYAGYLSNRERKTFPRPPYIPSNHAEAYVRPSDLGLCPLKKWHERNKTEPVFYESLASRISREHKFAQGEMDALPIIDAMLDKYGDYSSVIQQYATDAFIKREAGEDIYLNDSAWKLQGAAAETSMSGRIDGILVSGRTDGILVLSDPANGDDLNQMIPIEVKRSDPPNYNRGGENGVLYPKPYQLLQIGAYMSIMDSPYGALVLVARYGVYVWEVRPDGKLVGWYLWGDGMKEIEWNEKERNEAYEYATPEVVAHHVKIVHSYLSKTREQLPEKPYIENPLTHPQGWLCGKIRDQPAIRKTDPNDPSAIYRDDDSPDNGKASKARWLMPGQLEWTCPFGCHSDGEKFSTVYQDGDTKWLG